MFEKLLLNQNSTFLSFFFFLEKMKSDPLDATLIPPCYPSIFMSVYLSVDGETKVQKPRTPRKNLLPPPPFSLHIDNKYSQKCLYRNGTVLSTGYMTFSMNTSLAHIFENEQIMNNHSCRYCTLHYLLNGFSVMTMHHNFETLYIFCFSSQSTFA